MSESTNPAPAHESPKSIQCQVVAPQELSAGQRQQMFGLMFDHYVDLDQDRFFADLDEKQSVVLLSDAADQVQGFTTLLRLDAEVRGRPVIGYYSGDTVISPEYWGEYGWLQTWSRHVFGLAERFPEIPAYWILLTATQRTYRILANCFVEHYPRFDRPTPQPVQETLDCLVRQKFPDEYLSELGIVRLSQPTPVRPERMAQSAATGLHDPVVRYFIERNPGYLQSDYLACITRLDRQNLTPLGHRVVNGGQA